MPTTYEAIATVTVGSGGAASIDFTAIPATFTDLLLKTSVRTDRAAAADGLRLRVGNSSVDTGNNYSDRYLQGDGASATSGSDSSASWLVAGISVASTSTASTFSNIEIYLPNYAGSTNKSVSVDGVSENNATTAYTNLVAGLWSSASAINTIKLLSANSANFVQYSTATLYGIKNS
jgi:hypothetical protein